MYKALTIAGSDSSGGAGIQADIKTMTAHGVYAMSAITALTAQNTTGVTGIMEVSPEFLEEQMDCIFTDIEPHAVKIGMVSSDRLICSIAKKLKQYDAKNVVVDPVMVATSGSRLISEEAISVLKEQLFPLADVLTPNIPEAEVIAEIKIESKEDMIKASEIIYNQYGCPVLCKGGHFGEDADDFLYLGDEIRWLKGIRLDNPNTHGTGCTLSSAIASNLARGYSMLESVQFAKEYVAKAIADNLDIGKGRGPLNHMWKLMQQEENFMYAEEMYR
ncbi:bifunctional hydroxymethylpyrimidine kinase/phosphomethylpyrimidine kinase [Anaerosporobacter sp.]|uniref:bifunctional hydroxymethylpyrimidine kinase/phosphomethylpyrimidine kinase n=1 Tax=Anaerosporobacter sp. TaxID=1872529 RepID=UPI00286F664D|nr:bifunctional hydroxymethylpyrimidine kinase/phosphomethylpyrimidine kinase [Anaerosporobacter sp.]